MEEGEEKKTTEHELEKMTVKELRAIAGEETEAVGIHAMKKEELLSEIKKARGVTEEDTPKQKKKQKEITVKDLKEKIAEFKTKKEELRRSQNMRMVGVLRRRINRAKKRTRKLARV
jgi:Pyruvate/2-oxoacid:ferredoxin oxidoreductase gamma subunit